MWAHGSPVLLDGENMAPFPHDVAIKKRLETQQYGTLALKVD